MPIVAPEETCYTFSMEKKGALGALREKRCNMRHVLTSEAVTRGHPDKLCDQVADGVLDALLTEDPEARAACETAVWENHLLLFGEISARQEPDYEAVAREVLRDIGYDRPGLGLDADHCDIQIRFHPQSPDIAQGVSHRSAEDTGAGDQGIMTGYACRETPELMPLPVTLAGTLVKRLDHMRRSGGMPWLLPDGKAQVSVAYEDGRPARITTVVLSAQHTPNVRTDALREVLRREVILPVLPPALPDEEPLLYINPTGRFVIGGPAGDAGLTGRKAVSDAYGGAAHHGGGSLAGKDPTKMDRTGAYLARYLAKNVVAAGLADRCEVQLAYAIGLADPVSVSVNTFGTGMIRDETLAIWLEDHVDMRPGVVIRRFGLTRPIYRGLAAYGPFGENGRGMPWERTDLRFPAQF